MSLSPAIIDAMVASGCTAEQLAAVVKASLAEQEARAARQIPWPKLRQMAFDRDGCVCGYCGDTEGPFEVDHVVPQAAGGEDILENVVVACRSCNRAKKDRQGEDWEALRERRRRDRERKRSERNGQARKSANVTRTNADGDCSPPLSPPNDIYSNPPHTPPLQKSGAKRGARLSDDWKPKPLPSDLAAAVAKWPEGEGAKQLAMFRDWAASAPGSKGVKSDWDAAWRNWLRRVDGERPRQTAPPRQAPSNSNTLRLTREKLHGTGY